MRPPRVVKIDPALETLSDLAAGLESVQIDALVLQGAPEPFDHDVVHPAPFAVHGYADAGVLEHGGKGIAGVDVGAGLEK